MAFPGWEVEKVDCEGSKMVSPTPTSAQFINIRTNPGKAASGH